MRSEWPQVSHPLVILLIGVPLLSGLLLLVFYTPFPRPRLSHSLETEHQGQLRGGESLHATTVWLARLIRWAREKRTQGVYEQ